MIPIQLLCNIVGMSSVSVHISADMQIAKKEKEKPGEEEGGGEYA